MPSQTPPVPPQQRRRRPKRAAVAPVEPAENGSQYHQKAIGRALDVLESFDDERPERTLKEIAQDIGLPESSLFRILLTLESRGYLVQNSDGAYSLAPKVLLGRLQERAEKARRILVPHLQKLAGRFDETSSCAYLFENRIQALDSVETYHAIRMTNKAGRVLPPHASSLGKVITAFQKPAAIDRILEAYGLVPRTAHTICDRQALLVEFERIAQQGYAMDREESVAGGICVSAAVTLDGSPVTSALSVSTPVVRMTPERELEITRAVLDEARAAAHDFRKR
jgi:DNA-binding IclR family transcriptional regulator